MIATSINLQSRIGSFQVIGLFQVRNPNNFQMDIHCTAKEIRNIINDKEIEVLIFASIETLKREKSKCSKDEVFKLAKDTIEENITREIFDKL